MDVFISWAGKRSHAVAAALKEWLPTVINAVRPWMSSSDIAAGNRWSADIANSLEKSNFGILCLTPFSLRSEWLLFEAGALSKLGSHSHVCPLLIDLRQADVSFPLAQFQMLTFDKAGVEKMLKAMNAALREGAVPEKQLDSTFKQLWPALNKRTKVLPDDYRPGKAPKRDTADIAEETLLLVRAFAGQNPGVRESTIRHIIRVLEAVRKQAYDREVYKEATKELVKTLSGHRYEATSFEEYTSLLGDGPIMSVLAFHGGKYVRLDVIIGKNGSEFLSNLLSQMSLAEIIPK